MKLILDTAKKSVTVVKAESFEAVCEQMKEMFPNDWTRWILYADNLRTEDYINKKNERR